MKVLPVFGFFVLIAFLSGMLYLGFSTMQIDCARQLAGQAPDCEIRETRLFGLFERRAKVLAVSGVGYRKRGVNPRSRFSSASKVVLDGSNGSIPVSQISSNVGSDWKSELILKTQRFLDAPDERALSLRIEERNIFGWIGTAFAGFFVLGYVAWFFRKLAGRA